MRRVPTIGLVLFLAIVGVILVVSLVRGARSRAKVAAPIAKVVLGPGLPSAVAFRVESGGAYEIWLRFEVESDDEWSLSIDTSMPLADRMLMPETIRLHDDRDGGVAGGREEGVVDLEASSHQAAGHTSLKTTHLLARFEAHTTGDVSGTARVTPGKATTARGLLLLVARV